MKRMIILFLIAILMSGCIFKRGKGKHRGRGHLSLQNYTLEKGAIL